MTEAAPPPWFLFIRHGETDWNADGRLQGQRDIPLNRRGERQAVEAGRRAGALLSEAGRDPASTSFVTSPLVRTRATTGLVRRAMGLPEEGAAIDERLKEFSFGSWEGLTWPEVKLRDPQRLKARRADKWRFVPPEGESYAMLAERVRPWLATLTGGEVVVSHGGVARALMVLIGGASILAAPNTEIAQGRMLRFGEGRYSWH